MFVRLVLLALAAEHPERLVTVDGRGYIALARDLRSAYLAPEAPLFQVGLLYPPGYPAFAGVVLFASGGSVLVLALVQSLVFCGTLLLLFELGRLLFGARASRCAVLLLAIDPASALYGVLSQPETLFTCLVVASAWAWTKAQDGGWTWALGAGALCGVAMLVRPVGVLLPLAMVSTLLASRPRHPRLLRITAAALVPAVLLGGAWVVRNRLVTGTAFFAGIEGANGLYYRAAGALAEGERIPVAVARMRLAEREQKRGVRDLPPGPQVRLRTRLMLEVLAEHPLGAVRAALQGWARLLGGTGATVMAVITGEPDPEGEGGSKATTNVALAAPLAVLLVGTLLLPFGARAAGDRYALALAGAYLAYFFLTASFLEANTRFRVPMAPFLALLSARGWLGALETAGRAQRPGRNVQAITSTRPEAP